MAMTPPKAQIRDHSVPVVWERVGEKVDRLHKGMRQELASLVRDVEDKLESSAVILSRNTELLKCLVSDTEGRQLAPRLLADHALGQEQPTVLDDPKLWKFEDND